MVRFLQKFWIYPLLLGVAAVSFITASMLPIENMYKWATITPGVGALIAIIFQIVRDNISFQKQLNLQQRNNEFVLGVTSHISQKAFNKYSDFCDEYVSESFKVIQNLVSEGVSQTARSYSVELAFIRRKYINWIPEETKRKLIEFEGALFRIGTNMAKYEQEDIAQIKEELYDEADQLWNLITGYGIDELYDVEKRKYAYDHVEEILKEKLGVEEVTKLRSIMIEKAISSVDDIL